MNRKYEFTGETKQHEGRTLHRIRRLSDGKLGGWIERESNLSHEGDCWVDEEAMVYDDARVFGRALVCEDARVYGRAQVFGRALVYGDARVYGHARVFDEAVVSWNARVSGHARVFGRALMLGDVWVYGDEGVLGHARAYGDARLSGNVCYTEHYSTTPIALKGSFWDVVQHPSGLVSIGREKHPLTYWLENYKKIGTERNFHKDEVEECGELLHSLQAT